MTNEKYYADRMNDYRAWYDKSYDLRISAGDLWVVSQKKDWQTTIDDSCGFEKNRRLTSPFHQTFAMLCGLSLELLFKAIIIKKGVNHKNSHNLIDLSELSGLDLSDEDNQVLNILSQTIYWFGKYPVPTEKQKEQINILQNTINDLLFHDSPPILIPDGRIIKISNKKIDWNSFDGLWKRGKQQLDNFH